MSLALGWALVTRPLSARAGVTTAVPLGLVFVLVGLGIGLGDTANDVFGGTAWLAWAGAWATLATAALWGIREARPDTGA